MRAVTIGSNGAMRQAFHWTASRVLIASAVFAAPFALLIIKLRAEFVGGNVPGADTPVTIRFATVGLFACLLTYRCCVRKKRRR